MKRVSRRKNAAVIAVLTLVGGCISSPIPHTYVLGAPQGAMARENSRSNADRIQIERIAVPDYLDSTNIMVRDGAQGLTSSETGRWGERLAIVLRGALATDLRLRLPHIFVTTTRDSDPSDRFLVISISGWDVYRDGRCVLTASWSIAAKGSGSVSLVRDSFVVPSEATYGLKGDARLVTSMSTAVGLLADSIAASMGP